MELIVIVSVISLCSLSCATLLAPKEKVLQLSSDEPFTKFYIDGRRVGKRRQPGSVRGIASVRFAHEVSGRKKGCEENAVSIEKGLSGWLFGNIFLGGIIGLIVDLANGSHRSISKTEYDVTPDCDEPE